MVSGVPASTRASESLARRGEDLAARYLRGGGMRVLARNWRCSEGELDIVARWGRTVVVVEVKTRAGLRFGTPLDAVTSAKRRRLLRLGRRWAAAHGVAGAPLRVDVVSVLTGRDGRAFVLHHRGVA